MKSWRLTALATGLAAGCATAPPPALHSLVPPAGSVPAQPATAAASPGPALTVAVGSASVPVEVDRPQLVLRAADGDIRMLDQERWAEPLKAQLPRAVALSLAQRLPHAVVSAYPNVAMSTPRLRLTLDVQRFELQRTPPAQATLRVVWLLRDAAGKTDAGPSRVTEVSVPAAGGSATLPALVSAMRGALDHFAGEVAAQACTGGGC